MFNLEDESVIQSDTPKNVQPFKEQQNYSIAIERGRVEEVKHLLSEEPLLLNASFANGLTPLAVAINKNQKAVVVLLLSYEALELVTGDTLHPNAEDYANFWGKEDLAKIIKLKKQEKNCSIEKNTSKQETPWLEHPKKSNYITFLLKERKSQNEGNNIHSSSVPTLGDGNCAFNAFALGLCELAIADKLPYNQELYSLLQQSLNLTEPIVECFKGWLHQNQNSIIRQQRLQGILRQLAVNFIEKHYESIYKEVYESLLWDAYQLYQSRIASDDTFITHAHIKAQFAQTLPQLELLCWWNSSGKATYFNNLRQSAKNTLDQEHWGGEPELDALAMALEINIWWEKGDGKRYLGIEGGIIEGLSLKEIVLLRDLQIGESIGRQFRLYSFEEKATLEDYMMPLGDSLRIPLLAFIESAQDTEIQLPHSFGNEQTKAILMKRGILNDSGRLINDERGRLEKERIRNKILGITDHHLKQKVLSIFKAKELAFGIKNEGAHWTHLRLNVIPRVPTELNLKKDIKDDEPIVSTRGNIDSKKANPQNNLIKFSKKIAITNSFVETKVQRQPTQAYVSNPYFQLMPLTDSQEYPQSPGMSFCQLSFSVLNKDLLTLQRKILSVTQGKRDHLTPLLREAKQYPFFESFKLKYSSELMLPQHEISFLTKTQVDSTHLFLKPLQELVASLSSHKDHSQHGSLVQKLITEYEHFVSDLCQKSPEGRINTLYQVHLRTDLSSNLLMSKDIANKVLSSDEWDIVKMENTDGTSPAIRIGELFFKRYVLLHNDIASRLSTLDPGFEWGMYALSHLLTGQGLVPSSLLILNHVPRDVPGENTPAASLYEEIQKMKPQASQRESLLKELLEKPQDQFKKKFFSYAVQATPVVQGTLLSEYVKLHLSQKQSLNFDEESFSAHVINALLMKPVDYKGDNLMVTPEVKLVGFDNDLALGSMLGIDHEKQRRHYAEFRDFAFFLEEPMQKSIYPKVRDKILSHIPEAFILTWLGHLKAQNYRYMTLFVDQDVAPNLYQQIHLPIKLNVQTVPDLLKDFKKLQFLLRQCSTIKHQELFEKMFPLVAAYYEKHTTSGAPWAGFKRLYERHQSIEDTFSLNYILKNGKTVEEELKFYTNPLRAFRHRIQTLEEAVELFLKSLSWATLPGHHLTMILEEGIKYFPHAIKEVFPASLLHRILPHKLSQELHSFLFQHMQGWPCDETKQTTMQNFLWLNNLRAELASSSLMLQKTQCIDAIYCQIQLLEPGYESNLYYLRLDWAKKVFNENAQVLGKKSDRNSAGFDLDDYYLKIFEPDNIDQKKQEEVLKVWVTREYTATRLAQVLGFNVVPEGCAVKLMVNDSLGRKITYYGWLSRKIIGQDLQTAFEQKLKDNVTIDSISYSQLFLLSLLLYPEDGQPRNFMVTVTKEGVIPKLFSIDNKRVLVEPIQYVTSGWILRTIQSELNLKTYLYFLPNFNDPFSSEVKEQCSRLDIQKVTEFWLESLSSFDDMIGKILETEILSGHITGFKHLSLEMFLMYALPLKLEYIIRCFSKTGMTHRTLLKEIEFEISKLYENVLSKKQDYYKIFDKDYRRNSLNEMLSQTTCEFIEKSKLTTTNLIKNLLVIYPEFTSSIHWEKLFHNRQSYLLEVLQKQRQSFKRLNLKGCIMLRNEDLKILLKNSPKLERLNITNCPHLTKDIFPLMTQYSHDLGEIICEENLWLENLDWMSNLEKLETISLKRCDKLQTIKIVGAPKLKYFYVSKNLESVYNGTYYAIQFNNRGNEKFELNYFQEAIEDYDGSIYLDSKNSVFFYNRGNVKFKLNDYRGALEDYDEAIRLNSDKADYFNNRANAKYKLGNYRMAVEDYQNAINLNQNDPIYAHNYKCANSRLNLNSLNILFGPSYLLPSEIVFQRITDPLQKEQLHSETFYHLPSIMAYFHKNKMDLLSWDNFNKKEKNLIFSSDRPGLVFPPVIDKEKKPPNDPKPREHEVLTLEQQYDSYDEKSEFSEFIKVIQKYRPKN